MSNQEANTDNLESISGNEPQINDPGAGTAKKSLHEKHIEKKRAERWKTRFANAKMEDVGAVLAEVQRAHQEMLGVHLILYRALLMKGVITEADLKAAYDFEKNRLEEEAKKQFEAAGVPAEAPKEEVGEQGHSTVAS